MFSKSLGMPMSMPTLVPTEATNETKKKQMNENFLAPRHQTKNAKWEQIVCQYQLFKLHSSLL